MEETADCMIAILYILFGLALLVAGAELLVKGASRLAMAAKISPLIIGLTVVAFGTSSPELAVSLSAVVQNQPDIALGNIVGSNIFNILFILGVSAMITPLIVKKQLIRLDVPIMIGASAAVFLMGLNGSIGRTDGFVLFIGIIVYVAFLIIKGRKEGASQAVADNIPVNTNKKLFLNIGLIIAGLSMLTFGSRFFVEGAVLISGMLGISQLTIALTIVAIGTSLPEVATSIIASIHKEQDIAVGNIVGSNIFNIMAILGLSAIMAPTGIHVNNAALVFDLPIMVTVAVACLPIFYTKNEISKWEGALFVLYYIIYMIFLISTAKSAEVNPLLKIFVLYLLIPFTCIIFLISIVRSLKFSEQQIAGIPVSLHHTASQSYAHVKRIAVFTMGFTILLIGLAMIFLPGPGLIVIFLGIAMLGTEFVWAKKLQNRIKGGVRSLKDRIKTTF